MAAPITNEPYSEQVSRAFDALKFATPQQLAMTAQAVQGNPQSPEALALASANNFQQQQRAAGAQMPQQTVYQQQIGKLLASLQPPPQPAPMQAGIAGVGANQYAMQDAAVQDPMRNAGIGAAPENMPMQQAAAGGLIALAHGGEVRGFSGLEGSYAELGTEDFPFEEEEGEEADEQVQLARQEAEGEYDLGTGEPVNQHVQYKDVPKTKIPRQDGADVHKPAPGSSAAKIARNAALKNSVEDMMDIQGPSYQMSEELAKNFQGELKEANRDKWINALTQGIGGMLQAQTPHIGQAIGTGLLSGAAGYQQGAKEEADIRKQLLGIQLGTEKEKHADRRLATKSVMDIQAANTAAQRKRELELEKIDRTGAKKLEQLAALAGKGTSPEWTAYNTATNWLQNYANQLMSHEGLGEAGLTRDQALTRAKAAYVQQFGSFPNRPAGSQSSGPINLTPATAAVIFGGQYGQ